MDYQAEIARNTQERFDLFIKAKTDTVLQKDLVDRIKDDVPFFINNFCWAFNPNLPPYNFPFHLYPAQLDLVKKIVRDIETGQNNVTEKSREWGATFIYLFIYLKYWLIRPGFEALLLSLKEPDVDDKTVSSLFGKVRYNLELFPKWLMPRSWNWRTCSKFLYVKNPDNDATIVGRPTTPDAGRSGRKTVVLVDEHAMLSIRIAEGLEVNLRHVTRSLHRLSTPRGITIFKQIRDKGKSNVYTCHWTQIPPKAQGLYYIDDSGDRVKCPNLPYNRRSAYGFYINGKGRLTKYKLRSAWYDTEVDVALSDRDIAQELDISHLGSGFCRFNLSMIDEKSKLCRKGKRGRLIEKDGKIQFVESGLNQDWELEVWQFPKQPYFLNRSFIGADTAEGKEKGDFNCADVLVKSVDGMTRKHAASLHGHWAPDVFSDKLNLLGRWYDGGAVMCVELNKDGLGVALRLKNQLYYPHVFLDDKGDPGFRTTKQNKYTVTGDLDEALRNSEMVLESLNHYTEMSTFISRDNQLGSEGNNFDDRVMSLCITNFVANKRGKPKLKDTTRHGQVKRTLRTNTKGF